LKNHQSSSPLAFKSWGVQLTKSLAIFKGEILDPLTLGKIKTFIAIIAKTENPQTGQKLFKNASAT